MSTTIKVSQNFDFSKIDVGLLNQIGLTNSGQALQRIAQNNAPYETWNLSQHIAVEPRATKSTKQIRVWPRSVVYAIPREYVNYKNPSRKFYMRRTGDVAPGVVKEEFDKALQIIINSL